MAVALTVSKIDSGLKRSDRSAHGEIYQLAEMQFKTTCTVELE